MLFVRKENLCSSMNYKIKAVRVIITYFFRHSIDSQGTVLTNDKLRMTTGGSLPGADQSMRPFTSVNQFRGNSSQSN